MKISSACLVSLAVLKPDLFIIFVLLSLSVIALHYIRSYPYGFVLYVVFYYIRSVVVLL